MRSRQHTAFSLVELVIVIVIIGVVAAIAIPRISRGARPTICSALKGDLGVLRYALERYAAEHGGQYPVDDVAKQLTYYSDYQGISMSLTKDVANGVVYGPYLKAIPPLPVGSKKGATGIYESSNTGELPPEGVASDGWFYNSVDQVFKANLADIDVDDDGFRYNTY